jgi:sugar/nucleoside kinase (ribokinase family)
MRAGLHQDDIDFLPPTPPARNVVGGGSTYAVIGARIISPRPTSSSIGWVVDKGTDFPPHLVSLIDSWDTRCVFRPNPDRLTTRGWNGYTSVENRAFKYMTPKRRLTPADLPPPLLRAKSFHLICSPARCQQMVEELRKLRKEVMGDQYTKPFIIWEPVPDLCTPDQLLACTNTLPVVDVCSPNHAELAAFMGDDGLDRASGDISAAAVERHCEQLLASIPLQSFTIVVRAAHKGCYIARNGGRKRPTDDGKPATKKRRKKDYVRGGLRIDTDMEALFAGLLQDEDGCIAREEIEIDPGMEKWIPAYHTDASRVADPTGGGNAFLGALAAGLARGKAVDVAAVGASVAASFVIEQVGVPVLGRDEAGDETWNGVRPEDRLREFEDRLAAPGRGGCQAS